MLDGRRMISRDDALVAFWAVILGLAGAAVFAVYRAVSLSNEDVGGRLAEFGVSMLWPGVLIFAVVAVVIVAAWKANLD
jgi:hypothetical protein